MGQSASQKRPWIAALLAAIATGLGHIYLRRWRRAFGWLAVLLAATVLFAEPASLGTLDGLRSTDPQAIAPTLIVGGFSVIDAYVLARAHNAGVGKVDGDTGSIDGESEIPCPNCGKALDQELEFCHWCTTRVADSASQRRSDSDT
ncbi:MAG: DUF7575 domain-containing protein [Halobacteriota archaeon]